MEENILYSIGGISEQAIEEWSRGWGKSQASYPLDGPYFLKEEFLKEVAEITRLRQEALTAFFESGAKMRESEALSRLAWHCHWLLYIAKTGERDGVQFFSNDKASHAPEGCNFFMGIVIMSALPRIKAYYLEHGIPMSVLSDTMTSFDIWTEDYHDHKGVWGCDHPWIVHGLLPTLFRIGRLEFQFSDFHSDFKFLRRKDSREMVILAPNGTKVTSDGYICQKDELPAFTDALIDAGYAFTGFPVAADGRISSSPVNLGKGEWEPAFEKGDPMIYVHIPACAPLEAELTARSIDMARDFFAKYFPLFKYKGFQCNSWLLDSSLPRFLPAESNIIRFQNNFRLFPHPEGTDWQTRERVFGDPDLPLEEVPQRTSLQRIVKDAMLSGHRFRAGSGVILK